MPCSNIVKHVVIDISINIFVVLFQTYIDCLHIKKTDNSRINADDPMETEGSSTQNDQGTPLDFEEQVMILNCC